MKGFNVLPSFLGQRNQEVGGHIHILTDVILRHGNSGDGGTHAQDLLQLEADSLSQFLDLVGGGFTFSHHDGELTDLDESVTQQFGDLFHQGFGSDQHVIRLGPFLDEFLVFVELFKTVFINAGDSVLLGSHAMSSGTENGDTEAGLGGLREFDGTNETFIFFGVVVAETNLEFDGLDELTFFFGGKHFIDELLQIFLIDLAKN